jgi:carbon storage regulator
MPNLILTRRIGETVVIDEKITLTITEVDGNHVRLSIQAPREVNIRRGELPIHVPATTS